MVPSSIMAKHWPRQEWVQKLAALACAPQLGDAGLSNKEQDCTSASRCT